MDYKERGRKGVIYGVSDDHKGLVNAFKYTFQRVSGKRCPVHFRHNLRKRLLNSVLKNIEVNSSA